MAGLARRFDEVIATDASARQIEEAPPIPRVRYSVTPAEASPLAAGAADLVTVAQALHWFDLERFWREVDRVLAPRGIIAAWCYALMRVTPEVDRVLNHFYASVVGPYWPAERWIVEKGYGSLPFPFEEISRPSFTMEKSWTVADLLGYVRTWSATKRFIAANREDPVAGLERDISGPWGEPEGARPVRWDLDLRVGRKRLPG